MSVVVEARPREVPVPPWSMPAFAEQVYRNLGPLTYPDVENGYALAALVDAWSTVVSWIYDAAHPEPGTGESPWSAVLDPWRCPWWALRWCGQCYGIRLNPVLEPWVRPDPATEQRWRQAISDRVGWRRGHPDVLVAAARLHMVPDGRVRVRERYDPALGSDVDAPYHLLIRVRASDVLPGQEDALIREVLAQVPIGLVADVEISDAPIYDDLPESYPSYDAMAAAVDDYDALEGN